jgi:hypothetical protein
MMELSAPAAAPPRTAWCGSGASQQARRIHGEGRARPEPQVRQQQQQLRATIIFEQAICWRIVVPFWWKHEAARMSGKGSCALAIGDAAQSAIRQKPRACLASATERGHDSAKDAFNLRTRHQLSTAK